MDREERAELPLGRYRALDLTDEKGLLCGKILADLGMDVIKVERPGGDPARNLGPFYHDIVHPEKSLFWFALNTSKRGITLATETKDGQEIFLALVRKVDFVIESFPPGYMERLGLGYQQLSQVNPGVIMASISGFGGTGPYKDFKAPDIVCMAMGGEMHLTGDADRPPLRVGVPQAYLHAGAEAAVGCLIALWHRETSGEGQHVDVSAQECVTWEGFHNQNFWDLERLNISRQGSFRMYGRAIFRTHFPCKDGHVVFMMFGGTVGADSQRALVKWMDNEEMADDFLREFDWDAFSPPKMNTETAQQLEPAFARFFLTKTRSELFREALTRGFLIAPVYTAKDVLDFPHLQERGYWERVEHPELGDTLIYPGAPYISDETPYNLRVRAPLIGEHNDDIFQAELGLSREKLAALKGGGII